MKFILRKLGFLLLKLGGWDVDVLLLIASMPIVEINLLKDARIVVQAIDKKSDHGTSGEWKRHVAFSLLMKKYPNLTKRQIAMAIEIALG